MVLRKIYPTPTRGCETSSVMLPEASQAERTFSRKDHLVQHIRQVHNAPKFLMRGDNDQGLGWRRRKKNIDHHDPALYCGFCGIRSEDWGSRVTHVKGHLKAGLHCSEWDWDLALKRWPGTTEIGTMDVLGHLGARLLQTASRTFGWT